MYVLHVHVKRTFIEADSKTRQGRKMATNAKTTGLSRLRKSTKNLEPVNMAYPAQKLIDA